MATIVNGTPTGSLTGSLDSTPSASDTVIYNRGSGDITADLNGLAGTALARVAFIAPFSGKIGAGGSPVALDATTVELRSSSEWAFIKGVASQTITTLQVRPRNVGRFLANVEAATITTLHAMGGTTKLKADADVTNAYCLHPGTRLELLDPGAAALTTLVVAGAFDAGGRLLGGSRCRLERDVATATVGAGGVLEVADAAVTPTTLALAGGTAVYNGGNIGTVSGSGVLDLRGLAQSITVTTWALTGPTTILEPMDPSVSYDGPTAGEWAGDPPTIVRAA